MPDEPLEQPFQDSAFAGELQRFTNLCQVLAGATESGDLPLQDVAACMVRALPQVRTPAQFMLLRGIVADFAVHAAATSRTDLRSAVGMLQHVPPSGDDLGETLLRCFAIPAGHAGGASQKPLARLRAERAMATIVERCADPTLSVALVAEKAQVSAEYMRKLLNAYYGCGFPTARRHARIRVAQRLLQESLRSVKEIATELGYESTSRCDRAFKRECGVTPGEYRRERRSASI